MNLIEKNNNKYWNYINYLIDFIKKSVQSANAKGVVFGLSGGVDSSLLALIVKKTNLNYLGLILPIKQNSNDDLDFNCALKLSQKHKLKVKVIEIEQILNSFLKQNENFFSVNKKTQNLIKGNLLARIRMIQLYFYANLNNYLVLGTSNKCEIFLGYFTKFGDSCADVHPLANLNKSQVKKLATLLNVNLEILNRNPSANLWKNQEDEKELGFSYLSVDNYLNSKKIDLNIQKAI